MSIVDLHVHSTASDGECSPREVVGRATAASLSAIALTDHDTLDGISGAVAAGQSCGVRVVAGCEFSVAASWGEMHLLAYFLPFDDPDLKRFVDDQRLKRSKRAHEIVERLNRAGIDIGAEEVFAEANGGALGRPHVARVLVKNRVVADVNEAFRRYLAPRRPAFVPKQLPPLAQVAALVREVHGVTSAAHLGARAVRPVLEELRRAGVDGIEVLHPAHDERTATRIRELVTALDLLPTGGSDFHGDEMADAGRPALGSLAVPESWLARIESLHLSRAAVSRRP